MSPVGTHVSTHCHVRGDRSADSNLGLMKRFRWRYSARKAWEQEAAGCPPGEMVSLHGGETAVTEHFMGSFLIQCWWWKT